MTIYNIFSYFHSNWQLTCIFSLHDPCWQLFSSVAYTMKPVRNRIVLHTNASCICLQPHFVSLLTIVLLSEANQLSFFKKIK